MGDDAHMGDKLGGVVNEEKEKSLREVGVQSAWDDPDVQKHLQSAGVSRGSVIEEYKSQLG